MPAIGNIWMFLLETVGILSITIGMIGLTIFGIVKVGIFLVKEARKSVN
jgi:hypothetical protein